MWFGIQPLHPAGVPNAAGAGRPQLDAQRAPAGLTGGLQFGCVNLKIPRVPARVSEALVLRTYPLKEADLVVSFLTRDQGKLRGVA
jgi:hypothetical protein